MMQGHKSDKKVKSFFRITIPIFILEVLVVVGLSVYLILLPKNVCKVNVNYKNATVFIGDKEANTIRLKTPSEQQTYNFYEFDLFLEIEETGTFEVQFKLESDKYQVVPLTEVSIIEGNYILTMQGNKKEKLLTGIRIKAEDKLSKFKVDINISIKKI